MKMKPNLTTVFFFTVEAVLGVLIQFSSGFAERILCFSSVAIAALFSVFLVKNVRGILTVCGLIFTVCADVFLVLLSDGDKLVAMCFFSVVQILYFFRVFAENTNMRIRRCHLVFRIAILILAFVAVIAVLGEKADALSIISVLYFANLLSNIIFSFANFERAKMFTIGLLLFAFCDVLVGFSMMELYIPITQDSLIYRLNHSEINLIWLFYVPSQTLISFSTKTVE